MDDKNFGVLVVATPVARHYEAAAQKPRPSAGCRARLLPSHEQPAALDAATRVGILTARRGSHEVFSTRGAFNVYGTDPRHRLVVAGPGAVLCPFFTESYDEKFLGTDGAGLENAVIGVVPAPKACPGAEAE